MLRGLDFNEEIVMDSITKLDIKNYRDYEQTRTAIIVSTGRKWMKVLVVEAGKLKIVRRPLSDLSYMTSAIINQRKEKATLRRMARRRGTAKAVRSFLGELLCH
tara:strand:- start:16 stop:327 length:312 start_codon:yes stop_codon:yes gene_type:complete